MLKNNESKMYQFHSRLTKEADYYFFLSIQYINFNRNGRGVGGGWGTLKSTKNIANFHNMLHKCIKNLEIMNILMLNRFFVQDYK